MRPPTLRASSQASGGCVTPAPAMSTSQGSRGSVAPFAHLTVTCGQGARALPACAARSGSTSIATTLPARPNEFRKDGCIVTAAYSKIDDGFAGADLKQVEEESVEARPAAIDEA